MYAEYSHAREVFSGEKSRLRLGNTSPGRELNSLNEEDLIYTTLSLVRASSTRGLNSTYARRRGPTESRRSGRMSAIAVGSVDVARKRRKRVQRR